MDKSIKKRKGKENEFIASNRSHYRDILKTISENPPHNIYIGEWDNEGDLSFSINMIDLGLTYEDYKKYEDVFFSYFMIDFVGEFLIRENLHLFVKKFGEYDIDEYLSIIEEVGEHNRFGIRTNEGRLTFKFHISFLKKILTENLRENLGC